MKHYLLIIILSAIISSCSSHNRRVYICTGPYSRAYHKTSNCIGLDNCSRDIKELTENEAIDLGRHKCRFCY